MRHHILIATASRKRRRTTPELPPGAFYDVNGGCWMLNGAPLVGLDRSLQPVTKKHDLETGEDQKGE